MKLSHSKLGCILDCPMTYYLKYKQGISLKVKKKALTIGSDVHWGIEHNTSDLQQHFIDEGTYIKNTQYSREQVLAEAMVRNYLNRKDAIFDKILTDYETGKKLDLLDEIHELSLIGKLKSYTQKDPHEFIGIIDLLLLTNKGFIIIDYKTSSSEPDWNDYLDQIYRYIFIIKSIYPDTPVYKIGIINLIKSKLTWRNGESESSFTRRLNYEYEIDDSYLQYHEYEPSKLNQDKIDVYIKYLSHKADLANEIDMNNIYFINYDKAVTKYGKSDYFDIFYHTPSAYVLYNISDNIYDNTTKELISIRDCKPLDMLVIEKDNILNKYETFKIQALAYYSIKNTLDKDELFKDLKSRFIVDDDLLEQYWETLVYETSKKEK